MTSASATTTAPPPRRRPSTPYAQLTAAVQAAGLMRRRRGSYWVRIAATGAALAAVLAATVWLRDSWLVLLPAGFLEL